MDYAIKGGVNFDWHFTRDELASDAPLTIYTMAQPIPGNQESMLKIQDQIDNNYLDPRFKYPVT